MNRSFSEIGSFDSNNGIYEAFYKEYVEIDSRLHARKKQLSEWLSKAFKALTCTRARCLAKAFAVVASLVGLIGVAGAVEMENISLSLGLTLGTLMIAIEYFCLKRKK